MVVVVVVIGDGGGGSGVRTWDVRFGRPRKPWGAKPQRTRQPVQSCSSPDIPNTHAHESGSRERERERERKREKERERDPERPS